jgi:sortase A
VQWWRVVGAIGRFMMRAGVLVLLFVAYQLWGTGLATNRAQDRLEGEFAELLASSGATSTTTSSTTTTIAEAPTTTLAPVTAPVDIPPPEPGAPVGRIEIPAIGVDFISVQGVDLKWLKDGPGHFPQTPLPGQPGNVALAGHRTTYAAPFNRLDELAPGDEITFETVQGTFTYTVDSHTEADGSTSGHFIVSPSEVSILDPTDVNRVTLVACHPKYSARQRIVVTATLASPPAPPTPLPDPADPESGVTTDASVDALAGGDSSARGPAILWSLLAIAVWFTTWWVARRWPIWHKVPAYVVGVPIFAVVLFIAYENIARLLPASY